MSDVRDHLADVKKRCQEQGWQWWMIRPGVIVTGEPELEDEIAALAPEPEPVVRNPNSLGTKSKAQIQAEKRAKAMARSARRNARRAAQ